MATALPRITARVDAETQDLLAQAAAIAGMTSINSFVLNAAIDKAKQIMERERALKLSQRDAMMLADALDAPTKPNARLQQAAERYKAKNTMMTVKLDKATHDRQQFDCGVESLSNYLKVMASQQSQKDNTRTFVLVEEQNAERVIGYYTLTMTPIDLSALPDKLQKKHHNASSGGLIARLAIDKRYAKQGHGEWLLIDALNRLLQASETVAFPVVIVDAKDGAIGFYEKFGFTPFQDSTNKLFLTIADIRASIE